MVLSEQQGVQELIVIVTVSTFQIQIFSFLVCGSLDSVYCEGEARRERERKGRRKERDI